MKILITGACGFVGSAIAERLLKRGDCQSIIGIDNFMRSGSWINRKSLIESGVEIIHADIRNAADIDCLPAVDWVIDAAAIPSVLAGRGHEFTSLQVMQHNLLGTINIAEYAKRVSAGVIFLSSSRVYAINALRQIELDIVGDRFVLKEHDAPDAKLSMEGVLESFPTTSPVSLYGVSKLACEQILQEYSLAFDFPLYINRCGVISGAGQFAKPDQGIVPYWIHSWHGKRHLEYYGFDGYQVRDCLHPADLSALISRQIDEHRKDSPPIYNVSGGQRNSFSLRELSNWCSKRFGQNEINSAGAEREYDIPWLVLDNTQAKQRWDWEPSFTAEDIFLEIAMFAEQYPDWFEKIQ